MEIRYRFPAVSPDDQRTRPTPTLDAQWNHCLGLVLLFCRWRFWQPRGISGVLTCPWQEIKKRVEEATGETFNSVLCNRYRTKRAKYTKWFPGEPDQRRTFFGCFLVLLGMEATLLDGILTEIFITIQSFFVGLKVEVKNFMHHVAMKQTNLTEFCRRLFWHGQRVIVRHADNESIYGPKPTIASDTWPPWPTMLLQSMLKIWNDGDVGCPKKLHQGNSWCRKRFRHAGRPGSSFVTVSAWLLETTCCQAKVERGGEDWHRWTADWMTAESHVAWRSHFFFWRLGDGLLKHRKILISVLETTACLGCQTSHSPQAWQFVGTGLRLCHLDSVTALRLETEMHWDFTARKIQGYVWCHPRSVAALPTSAKSFEGVSEKSTIHQDTGRNYMKLQAKHARKTKITLKSHKSTLNFKLLRRWRLFASGRTHQLDLSACCAVKKRVKLQLFFFPIFSITFGQRSYAC